MLSLTLYVWSRSRSTWHLDPQSRQRRHPWALQAICRPIVQSINCEKANAEQNSGVRRSLTSLDVQLVPAPEPEALPPERKYYSHAPPSSWPKPFWLRLHCTGIPLGPISTLFWRSSALTPLRSFCINSSGSMSVPMGFSLNLSDSINCVASSAVAKLST